MGRRRTGQGGDILVHVAIVVRPFKEETMRILIADDDPERLYEWAREPKEKLIFERGDHNNIMAVNSQAYL